MLKESGFDIIRSKFVTEPLVFGGGKHLFVLAERM